MADDDWNSRIIAEFRANQGRVGGNFDGAPMLLLHHRGRRTGAEHVTPVMFLRDDQDDESIHIFASNAGRPDNPAWYDNLVASGTGEVEVGAETYPVVVTEVTGAERDRIFDEQVRRYPGFGGYARTLDGVRTIPVLALRRA